MVLRDFHRSSDCKLSADTHNTLKQISAAILNNDFDSYTYTENYSAKGVGVNGRLGVIYRPNLNWRIGLAVHTPTFYSITDYLSADMMTNTEGYAGVRTVNSATLDNGGRCEQ